MYNFEIVEKTEQGLKVEFTLNGGVQIDKAYNEVLKKVCSDKNMYYDDMDGLGYYYYDVNNIVLVGINPRNTRDNDDLDEIEYVFEIKATERD